MANKKKEYYKPGPMTEGKRNIIQGLLQEYNIESAADIQEALKDLLGGTIKEMMEAEMDELSGPLPELRIAVFPVIGASAIRVAVALQTDFITIINTRHSREGHLPQNSRLETLNTLVKPWPIQLVLCLTDSRYTFLARGLTQQGKNTLPVMTAQQIHHDIEILLWIILHQALEPLGNLSCIRICRALAQLENKRVVRPTKKHGNEPL